MRLAVKFHQSDQRIDLNFATSRQQFPLRYQETHQVTIEKVDRYEGDYDVTPKVEAQRLETKEKLMADDVRIKAIPFFEVSNNSGGDTIYIGMMDE